MKDRFVIQELGQAWGAAPCTPRLKIQLIEITKLKNASLIQLQLDVGQRIAGQDRLELNDLFAPNRYALQVKGDSMIDAGILDGAARIVAVSDDATAEAKRFSLTQRKWAN